MGIPSKTISEVVLHGLVDNLTDVSSISYTMGGIGHFIIMLLSDETRDDDTAEIVKQIMDVDVESCESCFEFQNNLIKEIKSWDAPFDENRIKRLHGGE